MDIVDSPREDDEEYVDEQEYLMNLEAEPIISQEPQPAEEDEFPFEVLTADQIVQHMVECIKDVNTIVQVYILNFHCFCAYCIQLFLFKYFYLMLLLYKFIVWSYM